MHTHTHKCMDPVIVDSFQIHGMHTHTAVDIESHTQRMCAHTHTHKEQLIVDVIHTHTHTARTHSKPTQIKPLIVDSIQTHLHTHTHTSYICKATKHRHYTHNVLTDKRTRTKRYTRTHSHLTKNRYRHTSIALLNWDTSACIIFCLCRLKIVTEEILQGVIVHELKPDGVLVMSGVNPHGKRAIFEAVHQQVCPVKGHGVTFAALVQALQK